MSIQIHKIIIIIAALCCIWCGKNPTENTFPTGARYEGAGLADRRGNQSADTSETQTDTSKSTDVPKDTSTAAMDTGNHKEIDLSRLGSSYFPLHIGDTWTYDVAEAPPYITSITDSVIINDKTYFKKSDLSFDFHQLFIEEDGVIYEYADGKEYVYLDFNKPVGTKFHHPKFLIVKSIESKTDTITWHGYKLTDCITIISENKIEITKLIYMKGLGLLQIETKSSQNIIIGGDKVLDKAVINGIEIK